jgi:Holliday junction DNA helicase RuvA
VIAHLRGQVAHRGTGTVVVDVQGVGYLVHVAAVDRVPPRGETVELHTSLQVREDAMTLYGFPDRATLELFELLLTASGVGPKLALAALATHRPDVLRRAIGDGDLDTITMIPGVGKKVAQRLVLELKDKVGAGGEPLGASGPSAAGGPATPLGEAREALAALGYSAGEIQTALGSVEHDTDDVGELVRRCLRVLSAPVGAGGRR